MKLCCSASAVVVLTVGVVVRGVVVVPDVLVRREVRGVLLQAAAARHVAQPVAVGAVAAAAAVACARAAAAEHLALLTAELLSDRASHEHLVEKTQSEHTNEIITIISTCRIDDLF